MEVDVVGGSGSAVARAPRLEDGWRETSRTPSDGWTTSTTGLRYRIRRLHRDQPRTS